MKEAVISGSDKFAANSSQEAGADVTKNVLHKSRLLRGAIALGTAAATFLSVSSIDTSAEASSQLACFGSSCEGLDPSGRCDGDAITAASMAVMDRKLEGNYLGQLDLRYSPSCKANWGRFTVAHGLREILGRGSGRPRAVSGRVTVWNPHERSYGVAGNADVTKWSAMTDGTKTACTGVEVSVAKGTDNGNGAPNTVEYYSNGWTWGPCR